MFAEARALRMTRLEAERAAQRVSAAYQEACRNVLPDAAAQAAPALRLTLDPESLGARFEYVGTPERDARSTPRAQRALRARAFLAARAARRSPPHLA